MLFKFYEKFCNMIKANLVIYYQKYNIIIDMLAACLFLHCVVYIDQRWKWQQQQQKEC